MRGAAGGRSSAALTIRPACANDVTGLHAGVGAISYRAWVAELEGAPAGILGLALTRPHACLFCRFDAALRPQLRTMPILRLLKRVQALIEARDRPVYALRDPAEPKAPAILTRLGFREAGRSEDEEVWVWEPNEPGQQAEPAQGLDQDAETA